MTTQEIEHLAQWSPAKQVETKRGMRLLRRASPSPDFWNVWRLAKLTLAAAGVTVGKNSRSDEWEVLWWQEMPPEYTQALRQNLATSAAASADIEVPAPNGCQFMPFQKAAVAFARGKKGVLLGDSMGLGKTIQTLGIINESDAATILVVCPAPLKINWYREFQKWVVKARNIGIAQPKLVPDTDVLVINYDILARHLEKLKSRTWDLVVADECHWAKSNKAARAQALFSIPCKRRLGLTGTPIPNRPSELFYILHWLDPEEFPSWWKFVHRYCGAHRAGLFQEGHLLMDEPKRCDLEGLQVRLRSTVMIRRLKSDVLRELPPVLRSVIELEPTPEIRAMSVKEREAKKAAYQRLASWKLKQAVAEAKVSADEAEYESAVEALQAESGIAFEELSRIRREMALARVPLMIEHLTDCLSDGRKVVVFGYHREVIERIHEHFSEIAVKHYGGMSEDQKQRAVDQFQNDPDVRLFVGSLRASREGITLTAAAHGVCVEEDWVPAHVSQCEARLARIGQQDSVLFQHLVMSESLDATMAQRCVKKQNAIDRALDNNRYNLTL